jgi:putative membrane protein
MTLKIARILVALVALIHVAIAATEMFLWERPAVHGRLGFTLEQARGVAAIVANVGLYNGFLAAGLIWSLARGDIRKIAPFFLVCVAVAGVFGAATVKWTTLVLQTAPAAVALLAVWRSRPSP